MPSRPPPTVISSAAGPVGSVPTSSPGAACAATAYRSFFGFVFLLLVVLCLLAPIYSNDIAHIEPNYGNTTGQVPHQRQAPVRPQPARAFRSARRGISHHYFLGADSNGRDVAVRLLYGGRSSLYIGVVAMLITMFFGIAFGVIAGYFRGWIDAVLEPNQRPGLVLSGGPARNHARHGAQRARPRSVPFDDPADDLPSWWASSTSRTCSAPIRAQVLTLREREFVDAARQQGLGNLRVIFGELLPNLFPRSSLLPAEAGQLDPARGRTDVPRRRRPGSDHPGER